LKYIIDLDYIFMRFKWNSLGLYKNIYKIYKKSDIFKI